MSNIISSWQAQYFYLVLLNFAIALGIFTTTGEQVTAQIAPDSTLPNNSTVNLEGNTSIITGGTNTGHNLFHSFQEFSVPTGATAHFNNAPDIQNIISRVTGSSISNIDGLIRANGNANLFILNPNGIIFGANASLDIGGSFFATTASSVKFADGFEWSAKTSSTVPILTVSVPIGLQFGKNPGRIEVRGNGQGIRTTPKLIDTTVGLRVQANQTLGLVGGDISLEGATLKTAGGRIELGSTAQESLVSLSPIDKGFSLGYEGVQNFGNIQLSQQTAVDASGEGGGDVQLMGKSITITGGSVIEASTLGSKLGGAVVVNASELVEAIGVSPFDSQIPSALVTSVYSGATGVGGNLKINTNELIVRDGGFVSTLTRGAGKGGNLTVNASSRVQLIGVGRADVIFTGLTTGSGFGLTGRAGDLTINTSELLIRDGAIVNTSTLGTGNGGNLMINVSGGVQLINPSAEQAVNGLITGSLVGATGRAGDLTINTGELLVRDGSRIRTDTFGVGNSGNLVVNASGGVQVIGASSDGTISTLSTLSQPGATGKAGDLTINTGTLLVQDGAQVGSSTFGASKGGNLTINATNSVQLIDTRVDSIITPTGLFTSSGLDSTETAGDLKINTGELLVQGGAVVLTSTFGSGNAGNLTLNVTNFVQLIGTRADDLPSLLSTSSALGATGRGGDIMINTDKLVVRDRAGVSVQGLGIGNAGNLEVNARSIRLENSAFLRADTNSINTNPNKPQATINLRSKDLVLLGGSRIATDATGENVIGGNINIHTDILGAFQNSDITANSADFRGGRVQIKAQGIFGTQVRNVLTPQSDITATGASPQLSGTIELNILETNPTQELVELPKGILDVSRLIAQNLCVAADENEFIITGRGGLPNSPEQALQAEAGWEDWRILRESGSDNEQQAVSVAPPRRKHQSILPDNAQQEIVEAQGWMIDSYGDVMLVANPMTVTPDSFWSRPHDCQTLSSSG